MDASDVKASTSSITVHGVVVAELSPAKACLSSDVIVARHLLSRSLLAASLTSLCCGVSVLLIWYNSLSSP